jgi:hypothetical protein
VRTPSLLSLALCALIALGAAAPALAIGPPAAVTGAAHDVTTRSATVTGTVDPNASATTYHFEYGTTTAYGLQSPDRSAGSGDAPVSVQAALSGLTSDTLYHYRLVASNTSGTSPGADRSFRTPPPPRPPAISRQRARGIGADTATLAATIDPNASPTTFHFEYGQSTSYGAVTPAQQVGGGDAGVNVRVHVGGLAPRTTYHFRAVASNAAGITRGIDRTFTTARLVTGISISLDPPHVRWGSFLVASGVVTGTRVGGVRLALERQDFPFALAFTQVGAIQTAKADGSYRFFVPVLYLATRFRVVTRAASVVASPVATAASRLLVSVSKRRRKRSRVRIKGIVVPAQPGGRATLQRRRDGRWVRARRTDLKPRSENRSGFRFTVKRRKRKATYRVRVVPTDGGAHETGTSRKLKIKRRRR